VPGAWRIELFDKSSHARDAFICGKADLDNYIKRAARRAQAAGTGGTWVAIDQDAHPDANGRRPVLGYYTIAMSSIDLRKLPEERRSGLPQRVPAALLGRLAVHESAQRQGLGELLLIDALNRIARAALEVPAHAVVLDAMDEDAKGFYERYGFQELTDNPLHLFLPMESVRMLVAP